MELIRRWQQQVYDNTALCLEDEILTSVDSERKYGEYELSQSFYSLYFPYKQISEDYTDSFNTYLDGAL